MPYLGKMLETILCANLRNDSESLIYNNSELKTKYSKLQEQHVGVINK